MSAPILPMPPVSSPNSPTTAAQYSPKLFEVNTGDVYREALKRTDEIMGKMKGWLDNYNNGMGSSSNDGLPQKERPVDPIVVIRQWRNAHGFHVKLEWGPGCKSLFSLIEEKIGQRLANFLIEDRGAPPDVAGELVARRINELFTERLTSNKSLLMPNTVECLRKLESEESRLSENNPAGPYGPSYTGQGENYAELLSETSKQRNEETGNPERWVDFVMNFVDEALENTQGLLKALENGVNGLNVERTADTKTSKSTAQESRTPTRSEVVARQLEEEADALRAQENSASNQPSMLELARRVVARQHAENPEPQSAKENSASGKPSILDMARQVVARQLEEEAETLRSQANSFSHRPSMSHIAREVAARQMAQEASILPTQENSASIEPSRLEMARQAAGHSESLESQHGAEEFVIPTRSDVIARQLAEQAEKLRGVQPVVIPDRSEGAADPLASPKRKATP